MAASPSQSASHLKRVNDELMYQWMKSIMSTPNMDKAMRIMVEGEFLHPYRDAQYYDLRLNSIMLFSKLETSTRKWKWLPNDSFNCYS